MDKEAIKLAREQFKIKYKGKCIAEEIDNLSDEDFLNKAKLTLEGKITYACMLLLGKNEDDFLAEQGGCSQFLYGNTTEFYAIIPLEEEYAPLR